MTIDARKAADVAAYREGAVAGELDEHFPTIGGQ